VESNHRHSDYEPLALPLSYAAVFGKRVYLRRCRIGTIREDAIRAGAGNRTPDLLLTMEALCRLSYSGGREMIATPT
jgi:hypothetical protein